MDAALLGATQPSSSALEHVLALSSVRAHGRWVASVGAAVLGLAVTEAYSWAHLSTRAVTGCAPGAGAAVPANATLASCAALAFFDGGAGAAVVTSPPPAWTGGLFLLLLAVVGLWAAAAWAIAGQTWRASALLPHGVFVRAEAFNARFYGAALALTGCYVLLKHATFAAQPASVTVERGGGAVTAALAGAFASGGAVGHGGLIVLGASLATLWLSFSSVSALLSRNAADAYADVSLAALVECAASAGAGAGAGGAACAAHGAAAPGAPSPVLAALAAPLVRLDARDVDARVRAWWVARGLGARGHAWRAARWLRGCDRELVADAAQWVREGGGGGGVQ